MTMTAPGRPRIAALYRDTAMRLAATEYQRFADLLRLLGPGDWAKPTERLRRFRRCRRSRNSGSRQSTAAGAGHGPFAPR
jgi:hypothetical protein